MSKKKNNKKDNVLIQTVKMQGEQAMHLVKQAKFNQNLLDEVIGLKDEMDRNVKKTNQKLTDIELLVEEVNKKVHIDDGEATEIKSIVSEKLAFSQICTSMSRNHILVTICSLRRKVSLFA